MTRLTRMTLLAAMAVAAPASAQDFMQYADPDGDGKVTSAEFSAFANGAWDYLAQGAESVKWAELGADAKAAFHGAKPDANGVLTKAAFLAASPDRFKLLDKNGDGAIDAKELSEGLQP